MTLLPVLVSATEIDHRDLSRLAADKKKERLRAARELIQANDESLLPGLVDFLFFIPRERRQPAVDVLRELSGHAGGLDYHDWVEYIGGRTDLQPAPGYRDFKTFLLGRIDERFQSFFADDVPIEIRLEEVVWGGVPFDGIPALESPDKVPADEAKFLLDDDTVLGVALGGVHHAYPVKVLSWHEMLNDTVGGVPITLSFCTLCGSAVLFSTARDGAPPRSFGTSGLLYRSNKLMYDRETRSLWLNLSGEAVVGPEAAADATLELLPVTLTRWRSWRAAHPETTVMLPDPELGARYDFRYREGAADAARSGVSFPVWQQDERFPPKERILALQIDGQPKAYVLEAVRAQGVVNDVVGTTPLVVVADQHGAVRAYARGQLSFSRGEGPELIDQHGTPWTLGELALSAAAGSAGEAFTLDRLPSHEAFWFGWYGVYPQTEVFPNDD